MKHVETLAGRPIAASPALLSVRDLSVSFRTRGGVVKVLERVSIDVNPGEIVGIVGESGSGKSVTAFTVMGILYHAAKITGGEIYFEGRDVLGMTAAQRNSWRGRDASIIFQNPRTALNPIRAVGTQIADVLARHAPDRPDAIRAKVLEALDSGPDSGSREAECLLPVRLSGGLCQRIGIAIALACSPRLLIADEPTTGLDVTTQAVIMDLIQDLARSRRLGTVLITHDLALASEYCDRIVVMHAGHIVEAAPVKELFAHPRHPYTTKLLRSVPSMVDSIADLQAVEGSIPDLRRNDLPTCRFAERCERRLPRCDGGVLTLDPVGPQHILACRNPL